MSADEIKVGVGVFIIRNSKVLLGERTGAHGAGTWALPGGQLEPGESIEDCARREVFEETGLELTSIESIGFTNDIFEDGQMHCVTLYVKASCSAKEAENKEPAFCKQWNWFKFNEFPSPLFLPLRNFLSDKANLTALQNDDVAIL